MNPDELNKNLADLTAIRLGIVTPMANERSSAVRFVNEVLQQCRRFNFQSIAYYIIFDTICTDGTKDLLEKEFAGTPEIRIIFAPENRNVVDAYFRGYRQALADENDWILEIDAGFSHQPQNIPQFFTTMQKGYDCVFGSRFMKGGVYCYNNLYRYIVSKWGTVLVNLMIGTRLKDMTSGFEIFTRDTLSAIMEKGIRSKGPFFQTEIRTYAHSYKMAEVPIQYRDGSHVIGGGSLLDSFSCLWHLFRKRLAKNL